MRSKIFWALAALNLVLLAALILRVTRENAAYGQAARPTSRGDYLMIAGDVNTWTSQAVFVVDSGNSLLGAMAYDDTNNRLDVMPPVAMGQVGAPAQAPARGMGVPPARRP